MTLQANTLNTNTTANCPLFLEWLSFVFAERLADGTYNPDSESCANKIEFVRALLRFALAPKQYDEPYPVEVIVYVFGQPMTGKTTFLEILQDLADENCGSWNLRSIATDAGRHCLTGKLVSICDELTGIASNNAVAAMIQIASNEPVRVRGPFSKEYSMERLGTVLIAAGNKPLDNRSNLSALKNTLTDLNRRIASLEVNRKIEQVDPGFKAKLKQELQEIRNWIMQISFNDAITTIAAHQCNQ